MNPPKRRGRPCLSNDKIKYAKVVTCALCGAEVWRRTSGMGANSFCSNEHRRIFDAKWRYAMTRGEFTRRTK